MKYEPETPEAKALVSIREQLRAGYVSMSRELMLQILAGLAYPFYSGLSLMDRDIGEMCQAEARLQQEWVDYAEASWLDTLADLVAHPTPQLQPGSALYDEPFCDTFTSFLVDIAARFPQKAASVLKLLLNDSNSRKNMGDYWFEEITEGIKEHLTAAHLNNATDPSSRSAPCRPGSI